MAYAALCGLRANGYELEVEVANLVTRPHFSPPDQPAGGAAAPVTAPAARPAQRRASPGGWLGSTDNWLKR